MSEFVFKLLASYLLGSLMGGLIVGAVRGGVDIRMLGSGNAGGTNALRTQGGVFAFWVMLIDIGKGFLATAWLAPAHVPWLASATVAREWLPMACGIAAILGHIWPAWYGFRGGKGVATVIGTVLGISAWLLVPMLLTWLLVVMVSGYVGLGSILAGAMLPAVLIARSCEPAAPLVSFGVMVMVLVCYTHRANITRMRAGSEPRAHRLWVRGRRHG